MPEEIILLTLNQRQRAVLLSSIICLMETLNGKVVLLTSIKRTCTGRVVLLSATWED